jgi:hypothetical protein
VRFVEGASSSAPFSAAALKIVEILRPHTPFAEAIVRRQAERAGISPEGMSREDVGKLLPLVIVASQAFVDPSVVLQLKALAPSR